MLKAITRSARLVDDRVAEINTDRAAETPPKKTISIAYFFDHYATEEYTRVVVAEEDFYGAQRELVPSVSAEELNHYERVRKEFEGGKEKEAKPAAADNANGTATREQMTEMLMKRMQEQMQDARDRGNGVGLSNGNPHARAFNHDEDDDYIIKTDHLSLNGSNGSGKGKGKGKGKTIESETHDFGDAAADDDMYA